MVVVVDLLVLPVEVFALVPVEDVELLEPVDVLPVEPVPDWSEESCESSPSSALIDLSSEEIAASCAETALSRVAVSVVSVSAKAA